MTWALTWAWAWSTTPTLASSVSCPRYFELDARGLCQLVAPYPMGGDGRAWATLPEVPELRQGLAPGLIELGRRLFHDPTLSGDGRRSCATCHDPARDFADGRPLGAGRDDRPLARGTPTLWNVAFLPALLWDGRARTLEEQALGPLFDAREMGQTPAGLLAAVRANGDYVALFHAELPDSVAGIEVGHVAQAIATFERTILSFDSPYDRYALGDHGALDARQLQGFNVFRSFISRCSECHAPPLFTNGQKMVVGVPDRDRPGETLKVPTLRNVARTAPYTHAGRFRTLAEVVAFYDEGGGRSAAAPPRDLHWHIRPIGLTGDEAASLVAFLEALSDPGRMAYSER